MIKQTYVLTSKFNSKVPVPGVESNRFGSTETAPTTIVLHIAKVVQCTQEQVYGTLSPKWPTGTNEHKHKLNGLSRSNNDHNLHVFPSVCHHFTTIRITIITALNIRVPEINIQIFVTTYHKTKFNLYVSTARLLHHVYHRCQRWNFSSHETYWDYGLEVDARLHHF